MIKRMPFYILLDTSQNMVGEPINTVCNLISSFISKLKQDPNALDSFHFSIITFGNGKARQIFPLCDLLDYPKDWKNSIQTSGERVLGHSLNLLETLFNNEVIQPSVGVKGDYTATLMVFCSGESKDISTTQINFLQKIFHPIYTGMVYREDDERTDESGYESRTLYCFNSKIGEIHKELFPIFEVIDTNEFEKTQQSMLFHLKKFFIS